MKKMPSYSSDPSVDFLTKKEVATILRLSLNTINKYLQTGLLGYVKISRFVRIPRAEFERFVQKYHIPSKNTSPFSETPPKESAASYLPLTSSVTPKKEPAIDRLVNLK